MQPNAPAATPAPTFSMVDILLWLSLTVSKAFFTASDAWSRADQDYFYRIFASHRITSIIVF
jgi:hypothetical protein